MSQLEKLLNRVRNNPRDVPPKDLERILAFYEFEYRQNGTSHRVYWHPALPDFLLPIPWKRPIKAVYVKAVLDAIERLDASKDKE